MILPKCVTNLTFVNTSIQLVFLRPESAPRRLLSILQAHLDKSCNLWFAGQSVPWTGWNKWRWRVQQVPSKATTQQADACEQLQLVLPRVPHPPRLCFLVARGKCSSSPGQRCKTSPKCSGRRTEVSFQFSGRRTVHKRTVVLSLKPLCNG